MTPGPRSPYLQGFAGPAGARPSPSVAQELQQHGQPGLQDSPKPARDARTPMTSPTPHRDAAGVQRATLRELSRWLEGLGRHEDLDALVDALLPGLRDAFRVSTVSLALDDPGLHRFRVAAYCYRRRNGKRSCTYRVEPLTRDPFWSHVQTELELARQTRRTLCLMDDGSLVLRLQLREGDGWLMLGPRFDGSPQKALTQELVELVGVHVAQLLDHRLERHLRQRESPLDRLPRHDVLADLASELARAGAQHHPVTLGIIEIDQLDRIETQEGSAERARVMNQVAAAIRQELGREDSLGEYSDREFMVVFPNASLVQASARVETVKRRVRHLEISGASGPLSVSISAGLLALEYGSSRVSASEVDDLLAVADFALLRAKDLGGDNVQKLSWRHMRPLGVDP